MIKLFAFIADKKINESVGTRYVSETFEWHLDEHIQQKRFKNCDIDQRAKVLCIDMRISINP